MNPINIKIISFLTLGVLLGCSDSSSKDPCEAYAATDLKMLNLRKEVEEKFRDDKLFLARLQDAQVYWTQYKDKQVRTLYPEKFKVYREEHGQEVFNPCKCKELDRLTKLRVEELKMFLKGGPSNQGECPSTWNE